MCSSARRGEGREAAGPWRVNDACRVVRVMQESRGLSQSEAENPEVERTLEGHKPPLSHAPSQRGTAVERPMLPSRALACVFHSTPQAYLAS